jgi:hypothetical protein
MGSLDDSWLQIFGFCEKKARCPGRKGKEKGIENVREKQERERDGGVKESEGYGWQFHAVEVELEMRKSTWTALWTAVSLALARRRGWVCCKKRLFADVS